MLNHVRLRHKYRDLLHDIGHQFGMLFGFPGLHDSHNSSIDNVLSLDFDLCIVDLLCLSLFANSLPFMILLWDEIAFDVVVIEAGIHFENFIRTKLRLLQFFLKDHSLFRVAQVDEPAVQVCILDGSDLLDLIES